MFSKTTKRESLMTTSMTYAQSPLVMVVPPGLEFSSFSKLLSPFDDSVWYFVNGMMLVVIFITIILKFQSRRIQDFVFGHKNRTPFLNIVAVVVGLPTHRNPGRNFSRWIIMMFIIMWLIFRSLYQAVLFKNLQSTERNLPVQTIDESLQLGFVYYMNVATQENIANLPELFNRRIVVSGNGSFEIMTKFNDPTTRAGFLGALDAAHHANKVKLYGFSLNICPEPLLIRQYGIVFPKDSFLVSSFDEKLIVLVENGLIEYWLSELTEKIKHKLSVREPIKLSLNHLLSGYQILCCGLSLAFIVLMIELISTKLKISRKLFT
jgi:hypothetical protein